MSDASVRMGSEGGQRIADALLRATGGYQALFLVPATAGDSTDAGQLGIDAPGFQELTLAPTTFRRTRAVMTENQAAKYELVVSASAVEEQVTLLDLSSADALLGMVAGVVVCGLQLQLEGWSCTALLSEALVYRLQLRVATPQTATAEGEVG